jgi:hypothetical protein
MEKECPDEKSRQLLDAFMAIVYSFDIEYTFDVDEKKLG